MGAWDQSPWLGGFFNSSDGSDGGAGQNIANIGNQVQQAGAASQQEKDQYSGSFDIGNLLKKYFEKQLSGGSPEQNYQNQGALAQSLYNQTLQRSQNPTEGWTSALKPQLDQAQNQINEYYNNRGLINSGIAIGDMGTAGVDLAIKNAQDEMAYQQQSLQNANALENNIFGFNQQNLQNLSGLYGEQQQFGQNVADRALQAFETGAGYQAYPEQAALGSYYGQQAANQALPGQLIGAGGQLGAAYLLAGCWVASSIFGGWHHPKTVSARIWVNLKSPLWFKSFYLKNGENIALFINNKPILKCILRPLFELFALLGRI